MCTMCSLDMPEHMLFESTDRPQWRSHNQDLEKEVPRRKTVSCHSVMSGVEGNSPSKMFSGKEADFQGTAEGSPIVHRTRLDSNDE